VNVERMRPGQATEAGISASCFLQCLNAVGYATGRTSNL